MVIRNPLMVPKAIADQSMHREQVFANAERVFQTGDNYSAYAAWKVLRWIDHVAARKIKEVIARLQIALSSPQDAFLYFWDLSHQIALKNSSSISKVIHRSSMLQAKFWKRNMEHLHDMFVPAYYIIYICYMRLLGRLEIAAQSVSFPHTLKSWPLQKR